VPQLVKRDFGSDRDRGGVEQLLHSGAGECRPDDDAAPLVDDELARAHDAVALDVGTGDVPGPVGHDPHVQAVGACLRFGQTNGRDLRVCEGHPWDDAAARDVMYVPAQDRIGGDPTLVFAHVGEQCFAVAVTDGVQPAGRNTYRAHPVINVDPAAGVEPDDLETEVGRGWSTADGDEDLVGDDLRAVGQRGDHRSVGGLTVCPLQEHADADVDAVGLERRPDLVTDERLLAGEQSRGPFDDGDFI
jgi:hypothetical protein